LLNNVFSIKFNIKGIGKSPYEVMFGCKARVGLASVGILVNEICNLSMEEDIEKIMLQPENNEDNEIRDKKSENNEIRDEKCLGLLIFLKL
jgi:hypothetical protein